MAADKDQNPAAPVSGEPGHDGGESRAETGAPAPDDALDPELIALPRARPRVGFVVSLSVIVLSVFLLIELWGDFEFARQDRATEYDSAAALLEDGGSHHFVSAPVIPDFAAGVVVRKSKGSFGHRLHPVLGTAGRLWIMTHSLHWHASPAYDLRYRGRLATLGELPFWGDLADDWLDRPPSQRVVPVSALREALASGAAEVEVAGGDRVPLSGEHPLEIAQLVPGEVAVTAYYTDEYPDERSWTLALEQAGLDIESDRAQGQGPSGETFLYRVRHPDGADAVTEILRGKKLYATRAEPVVEVHRAAAGALRASNDGLELPGDEVLPWDSIDLIRIAAAYPLDPDARVLIASDRPDEYWYVYPLIVLLALSALLFLYVLARPVIAELRPRR